MPLDARSERNLATLLPLVQQKARLFLIAAAKELPLGWRVVVTSGTRTWAEQDMLYAQGRTRPGRIVTNARGGYSNHNFGIAFDVTLFRGSTPVWESPLYRRIARLAKALGFEWGGDWQSMKDEPHYQWPTGRSIAEMRRIVQAGGKIV